MRQAFALKEPGGVAVASLGSGSAAVVALQGKDPGDPAELEAAEREQVQRRIARRHGELELRGLVRALREEAEVEINRDRL